MSDIVPGETGSPTAPPRSGRARRVVGALALVVGSVLALAAGLALAVVTLPTVFATLLPAEDPRVLGAQTAMIDAVLESNAELDEQLSSSNIEFESALTTWEGFQSSAELWRATVTPPPEGAANPGGDAMPGDDPDGRALLDSIGATGVTVAFDASDNNCGYASIPSNPPFTLSVGGCYNSAYRNTLFMAWDPGTEDSVWPIFVHEAMHWYQAEHHFDLYFAIDEAGADQAAWSERLEVDASCRAVFQIGIPIEAFDDTSAPCTAPEWHDGWLVEQAAALGARTSAPDPEAYEQLAVVRP